MKRIFILILFLFLGRCVIAQNSGQQLFKEPIDSNFLIVVNGKAAGRVREIKKDINSLFPPDMIERINVLKGKTARDKYGETGNDGVVEIFLKDVTITGLKLTDTNGPQDSVYRNVEVQAAFPSGDRMWISYLQKNLKAEVGMENFAPPGSYTVVVEFIVNKNGEISEIKPLTNHGFGMEAEVMRVVSKGPKWVPAIHHGRHVSSYRKQPVTFVTTLPFELSTYKLIAGKAITVSIELENKKVDDLDVTISNGTVQKIGDKQYSILVDRPGRVFLTIKEIAKKKKTDLGTVAIEVN